MKASKARMLRPPPETPDFMAPAWMAALHYAIRDPNIVGQFRQDTGANWVSTTIPLEQMTDMSQGRDRDFVFQFADWFNRVVWGPVDEKS